MFLIPVVMITNPVIFFYISIVWPNTTTIFTGMAAHVNCFNQGKKSVRERSVWNRYDFNYIKILYASRLFMVYG